MTETPETLARVVHASAPRLDAATLRSLGSLISEELPGNGAVLLRGFGIDTEKSFLDLVQTVSGTPLEYSERSSPRTRLTGNIYSSTDYPSDHPIFLHNENSYQISWPLRLHFCCLEPPETLGATPLADTRGVYRRINPDLAREFEDRGWQLVRNFHDGLGVRWQDAFGTNSRADVETYCASHRIQTEWISDEWLRTRTFRNATHQHPLTGEITWFNHATFFHVTTLASEISEALRSIYADDDLPANTYFGDGSAIPTEALDHLRDCYNAESTRFEWERGDVLIIDNMNVAHGRERFTGGRRIAVAMTSPHGERGESRSD